MRERYLYPKLSSTDLGLFRVGGPGLANCMFFVAKAYVRYLTEGGRFISPTWNKFSFGPYIRRELDKRSYVGMFRTYGISGLHKSFILLLNKLGVVNCEVYDDLGDYFTNLQPHQQAISSFFKDIVYDDTIGKVESQELSDMVAIHVRMGDYPPQFRIPIEWYRQLVLDILKICPSQRFILFSDGRNDELKDLIDICAVSRVFYGNAFADMWAISKSKMLIASDSTFSAWGAFLGNVPIIFNRRHFPPVYSENSGKEYVIGNKCMIPDSLKRLFK